MVCKDCDELNAIYLSKNVNESSTCPTGDTCNVCSAAKPLENQIIQTETLLKSLFQQLQGKRAETNRAHSQIIMKMPFEIMSLIFQFSIPHDYNPLRHRSKDQTQSSILSQVMKLGAICQTWRQIAWSTAQLWTNVVINLNLSHSHVRMQLIRDLIARSGSRYIDMTVYLLEKDSDRATLGVYVPLLDQIASSSQRWQSINMKMPESLIKYLCNLSAGSASKILFFRAHITLCLADTGPLRNGLPFLHTAQFAPKVARLSGIHSILTKLRWERVTILSIDRISVGHCSLILRLAPLLSWCSFFTIDMTPADNLITNVIHRNLKDLVCGDGASGLFLKLTLPNLQRLTFRAPTAESDPHGQRLLTFLERSSCPLSELWLCESRYTSQYLMSVFKLIPSLSRLGITTLPHDNRVTPNPFIKELLEHLASTTIFPFECVGDGDSTTDILLPNLVSISFTTLCICPFPWDIVPALFIPNFNAKPLT